MPDLRHRLDDRAGRFTPSADAFDQMLARADRRRRARSIGSAMVALSVTAAVAAGIVFALRADPDDRPAIDPDPSPDASVHTPEHISTLVSLDGALWGLGIDKRRARDHYLVELDPRDGEVLRSFRVPGAVFLTTGGGSLWVTTYQNGRVFEIDPVSGRVVRTVRLGQLGVVPYVAWDDGRVFVVVNGSVARIDPESDRAVP